MKVGLVSTVLISILFAGFSSHRTDFSGKWALDKKESDTLPKSFEKVDLYQLGVKQTTDTMRVEITLEGSGQHVTFPMAMYTFDGKEVYRNDSLRATKRWSKGTWTKGEKMFVVDSRVQQSMSGQVQEFTEHEVWQLVNPTTLHLTITKKYPNNPDIHKERRVFHRVP